MNEKRLAEIISLRTQMDALGRPLVSFEGGLQAGAKAIRAAQAWDAHNPITAAEYQTLVIRYNELLAPPPPKPRVARGDSSGAPERAYQCARNPEPKSAVNWIQKWLRDGKTWAVMLGDPGNGKTVAACVAIRATQQAQGASVYHRAAEIAVMSQFDEGEQKFERAKRAQLLVVDEVGRENLTPYAKSRMTELYDYRHGRYLRTILVSNNSWDEVVKHLGIQIADRIKEDGGVMQFTGVSMRVPNTTKDDSC